MLQEADLPTEVPSLPGTEADPMTGRWSRLRPLRETDYYPLYEAEMGTSWRLRGRAIDPKQYVDLLHRNILTQMVVTSTETDDPLGLVSAYSADLQSGHCKLLMVSLPGSETNAVRVMEGVTLMLRHLFNAWPFRKVYFETDQPGVESMISRLPEGVIAEEGRLVGHTFQGGAYVDHAIHALYREQWEAAQYWFEQPED